MLCHNGDGSGQKKFIPCFGVREKNQFRKIVERFRCRAPWRQRKLVTEFRTRNCAERTLRVVAAPKAVALVSGIHVIVFPLSRLFLISLGDGFPISLRTEKGSKNYSPSRR